ncbi:response regulator [Acidovorax sp. A1169]|uniref:response regulator n=1 Tax=Acidovorax sp. A1169 TaxID=3059524 RepID=UPI002737CBBA|nr:response regulator [Acidovorax sp. A1169]MDP4078200.1 response regulator [Acidovorax sp. A1169]
MLPPANTSAPAPASATPESPPDSDGRPSAGTDAQAEAALLNSRILVVDDQAAHVHLLERLLHEAGYLNVSATMDARQVAALHRQHDYDLILLDLKMPGMDGFGVMEALRADTGNACLPVIVLTAQPVHKLRALQAGARDFINKPFETVEVTIRIHHMLEVRLLQKQLEAHNRNLERLVRERTAELQESEARYRSLTELAVDWYWEQNDAGTLTKASGLVTELLGQTEPASGDGDVPESSNADHGVDPWDAAERQTLRDNITARRPFLDLLMHRRRPDGTQQQFKISGEPMLDSHCRFIGYRGLGVEDCGYR